MWYNGAMKMKLKAHAKINLALEVVGKRSDGYHDLRSVMHEIALYDTVTLTFQQAVSLSCPGVTGDNAAEKAARLYAERYPGCGAHIEIVKQIPMQAGLGGASADAAAVLRGLNAHYGRADEKTLFALARAVGADVPFCLLGGCAFAEGIGDILTPLPQIPLHLVIVKGAGGVSTKALFSSLKLPLDGVRVDLLADCCRMGDPQGAARLMQNALEAPAKAMRPEIGTAHEKLLACGAIGAAMTGSGACVVGAFAAKAEAEAAAAAFADWPFVCVTETVCV